MRKRKLSGKSTIRLVGEWRLYEEDLEQRHVFLDVPREALEGTASGFRVAVPAQVWEILRGGSHSASPFHRMTQKQLRKFAELWVDHRLRKLEMAKSEAEREEVYRRGCLAANLSDPRDQQVEDFVRCYSVTAPLIAEDVALEQLDRDPDFDYSVFPHFSNRYVGETNMERGSFCYFCGSQLTPVSADGEGGCYECPGCPPVTHWRWNEDTEFLQLYVAGEQCPFCDKQIPELEYAEPVVSMAAPVSAAPVAQARPEAEEFETGQQRKKSGKPVTVDGVWWASVVEWCRVYNDHETRNHHNCSKELARMQLRGETEVVWHNRDRIPGTQEPVGSVSE